MKILYFTDAVRPSIGGVEVLTEAFVPAMRARGHELCVVASVGTTDRTDREIRDGVSWHRFPFHAALKNNDLRLMKQVADGIKQVQREFCPDVVHVNLTNLTPLFFTLSVTPGAPTLGVIHALPTPEIEAAIPLMRRTLARLDWVVGVSRAILDDALKLGGTAAPYSVIYNGLAVPPQPITSPAFDPPVLLCLGRLSREKGFDLALRALPAILERFPSSRLIIAGDGPERPGLEALAEELGLRGSVSFVGWVAPDATPSLLDSASVVLLPARWREPFCLVALEAAHRARPVVAARAGGLPEVVLDGETGILVEPEDTAGLAAATMSLLDDPSRARALGTAACSRASQLFGWNRLLDEYETLYQRLTVRPGVVSVVVPVFNAERYVAEALESVFAQTGVELQVVAVDDGSTDGSSRVIVGCGDRVELVTQTNQGASAAVNHGLARARGEYLAFLDADDLWMPGKLEAQKAVLDERPDVDMVYTLVEQFQEPGQTPNGAAGSVLPGYCRGTLLIRAESYRRVGGFDRQWRLGEFIDWYLRACDLGLVEVVLPQVFLRRRIHGANTTQRLKDSRIDYVRLLKASLDRRRAFGTGASS